MEERVRDKHHNCEVAEHLPFKRKTAELQGRESKSIA